MPTEPRKAGRSEFTHNNSQLWVYLTQKEAADLLRVSARTLERHRLTGTGPAYVKVGRKVVYRPADIEAWASRNTFRSTSETEASRG